MLIVSGSLAACNAAGLASLLRERIGLATFVVLTKGARRFVTTDAIRYAGEATAVVTDNSEPLFGRPDHIWLASHALGILVYPASADFIGRTACGLATDVASTTFLTGHHKPRMVVPSMNSMMWSNNLLQRNLNVLRENGVEVVDTNEGQAPDVAGVCSLFESLIEPSLGRV
ncbi:flavoprotein [Mesorhizobium opportunistum]|uniref:flavoprotein n=1 Tax=Mesorhizobium opportunistum TaxID=593909 RepID=UPI003306CAE3